MSPRGDIFLGTAAPSAAHGHIAELLLGKDGFSCSEGAPASVFSLSVMKAGQRPHSRFMIAVSWTCDGFIKQTDWKNGQNNVNEWGNAISKHSSYIAKAADDS